VFSKIVSSSEFVLIDFYADWCEPCKWVEPVLDDVLKNFSGKIILHKIDIDKQPDVARENHILSVPTLMLFKKGEEIWRMRGFDTAPALTKIFSTFILT
jgi:thioredoxin 1